MQDTPITAGMAYQSLTTLLDFIGLNTSHLYSYVLKVSAAEMICSMGTTYRLQHKVHNEKTATQENAVSVISVDKSAF